MYRRTSKLISRTRSPQKTANMLVIEKRRSARSGERLFYGGFNFHMSYKLKTFKFLK